MRCLTDPHRLGFPCDQVPTVYRCHSDHRTSTGWPIASFEAPVFALLAAEHHEVGCSIELRVSYRLLAQGHQADKEPNSP